MLKSKQYLDHNLQQYYDEIKAFKKRNRFKASSFYAEHHLEIKAVIDGLEWDNTLAVNVEPKDELRIVSWNIERGKQLRGLIAYLKENPELSKADVILAIECDNGMGRTNNINVAKELAEALGMNYCFAPSYLVLGKGAVGETNHKEKNTTALHGTAILSKYPITEAKGVKVPPVKEVFHSSEKRLGCKKGMVAKIIVGNKSLVIGALHIDLSSTAKDRANQLEAVIKGMPIADIQLLGGDWNTSTFNLRRKPELAWQVITKFITIGFKGAIENYMTPELKFDKPIFDMLQKHGFEHNGFNDKQKGSIYFDINDLLHHEKATVFVPRFLLNELERRLRPWNGCVPLKIDWFAGKGAIPLNPQTIEKPEINGILLSDHNPIAINLKISK